MVLVREKTYLMFDKNLVLCDIKMIDFIIISVVTHLTILGISSTRH